MKNNIQVSFDQKHLYNLGLSLHLRRCINQALLCQNVTVPCEINVLITDNQGIQEINRTTRNIDRATDVLSFPMFNMTAGILPNDWTDYLDVGSGRVVLGDMVISLERAVEQSMEYGHSLKREIGYLTVHSVLHLLGYDHMDEGEMKQQMRRREEIIMQQLDLPR